MQVTARASVRSGRHDRPRRMSWAALADWWTRRRTRAAIRHLDAHLRRDIGLDPIPLSEDGEIARWIVAMKVLL